MAPQSRLFLVDLVTEIEVQVARLRKAQRMAKSCAAVSE